MVNTTLELPFFCPAVIVKVARPFASVVTVVASIVTRFFPVLTAAVTVAPSDLQSSDPNTVTVTVLFSPNFNFNFFVSVEMDLGSHSEGVGDVTGDGCGGNVGGGSVGDAPGDGK